ncbi:MAG: antibiotic biosynthesis monooxygenase family protein [Kangiellaceae bacterium]
MILEAVILNVKTGESESFENAFVEAKQYIEISKGYISHTLHKCVETKNRYILQIKWRTLEDHTEGFRNSVAFEKWRDLLHHFYEPRPVVEHFELLGSCSN